MVGLVHLQTLTGAQIPALGQLSRFALDEAAGRMRAVVYNPAERLETTIDLTPARSGPSAFTTGERAADDTRLIDFEGSAQRLDRSTLVDLAADPGSTHAYLGGTGFFGHLTGLHSYETGGQDYMLAARPGGAGVSVYSLTTTGYPTLIQTLNDTAALALRGVSAMTSLQTAGQTRVITASGPENGLSVFRADASGQLRLIGDFGFAERLPVDAPSTLASLRIGGQDFVLLGAHGTGSLTVLSLDTDGQLAFADQINDSLESRFAGMSAMSVFSRDDLHLVAVGGNDGGISLYQVLPGGRLVHRETLIDSTEMALASIQQMAFVTLPDRIELLVLSARDVGLTRLELDPGPPGLTATGRNGTPSDDILTASAAGGTLRGGAGADVMIDAAGTDVFHGDAGADIFIFRPDTARDTVRDFDPLEDLVDLSAYPMLNSVRDIALRVLPGGIRLRMDGDELSLLSTSGAPIEPETLAPALRLARDHVLMPDPLPQTGSAASDVFETGAQPDTIDGGAGFDFVSYARAAQGTTVDLGDNAANGRAAQGYVLRSIEGVTGSAFNDVLRGTSGGNTFNGLAGHDTLMGGGGNDWLTPGRGSDVIDGGDGTDMISFVDYEQAVIADLNTGRVRSGPDTNTLSDVENLTGSIYGDFIHGNGYPNFLRGLGNYDWIIGSYGADTIDGGGGRDMISYVYAPGRVEVDLGAGVGRAGQAAGDRYVSVERATGSIYPDLFFGGDGNEDFRGLGGYDWFYGSDGRDRYDGGWGLDTVSYALAGEGVIASLLLGYGSGGDAAGDLYTAIERLTGTSFDDILTGDHGRNQLRGMYGEDTLRGNGGIDRLTGGGSDDYLDGGAGFDYALYNQNRADYTITPGTAGVVVSYNGGGGEGTDTLFNIEALQFADDMVFL